MSGSPQRIRPLAKIVSTLGPASSNPEMISRLLEAGVSVFRVNFSHGSFDDHAKTVSSIRKVEASMGYPVAILGDLPGPKIRVGEVPGDGFDVEIGDLIHFDRDHKGPAAAVDDYVFSTTYRPLGEDVHVGHRLLVADGLIRMLIIETSPDRVSCRVTAGGRISSHKGINLPDTDLSVDSLSERDRQCASWAVQNGLDFVGMSFVRNADDVNRLRSLLEEEGQCCQPVREPLAIVSKIETKQAVENFQEILAVTDSIMIARGDLGVELDCRQVPVLQRQFLELSHANGKPCIVATQMLESMIEHPTPTRAEASDVANAIAQLADAVMLSGETAVGKYPALAVEQMRRIAETMEAFISTCPPVSAAPQVLRKRDTLVGLAHGVHTIVQDISASLVAVWSERGLSALSLSQSNLSVPILAMTSQEYVSRQLCLLRGVIPIRIAQPGSVDELVALVDSIAQEHGWVSVGDRCVIMTGKPVGRSGKTNRIIVHAVGSDATV
ncbi:MAG: pyruvate kinase [Phycisphaerales bacterium]|nr:pyruvate kinase [Phycisphaerales bacterium]